MADLITVQEVLDHFEQNMSTKARLARIEAKALKKDIETAQALINDAVERYRKKKLRVRNKVSAKSSDPFKALDEYSSCEEIRDAYGWGFITQRKMDRLLELWELREQSKDSTIFTDRVIEMLEAARMGIFSKYGGPVREYQQKEKLMFQEAKRIAEENFNRNNHADEGGQ